MILKDYPHWSIPLKLRFTSSEYSKMPKNSYGFNKKSCNFLVLNILNFSTMKKLLGLVFLMLLLISGTGPTSPKLQSAPSIEGTWELVSFNNYDGKKITTVPTTDGYRQIKMYYNGKVMWTRYVPKDSVEWFGYGSYSTTDSTLTERLEYMS